MTATASAFYVALEFTQSMQRLERIEVSIKAHDTVDVQATHHRNVNRIPCGYRVRSCQNDVLGHLDVLQCYRGDVVDQTLQDIKRWLDGFGSPYRNVSVKDLLKDLNVGDQCLPVDDKLFKEPSCDVFVGWGAPIRYMGTFESMKINRASPFCIRFRSQRSFHRCRVQGRRDGWLLAAR